MKDLVLDQETAEKVLNLSGVSPMSAELSVKTMERGMGYSLAVSLLYQQMQDGRRSSLTAREYIWRKCGKECRL